MISAQRVVGNGRSLLLCHKANGEAPQHRPTLQSGKITAYNNKPSETLARRFRGLTVYSVSIGFSLIMGYVIIPIWTCAERNESAPIGFGLLDYN